MSILMTGLTGILGSNIGPELEDAYFIVRNGIDNKKIPIGIDPERILAGDITKPFCGLSQNDLQMLIDAKIDRFLHLAANVSFALDDADGQIWLSNYGGTFNAVELAKKLNVKEFLHCSTAYAEDQRNPYEMSKMSAEKVVKDSGIQFSIFRPSAMVGHSETGYTADFNGYYGVYSFFHVIAEKERGNMTNEPVSIPVYVVCSSKTTINLIPLDWVKYTMLGLLQLKAQNQIYYLTHDNPPQALWVMQKGFEILNIKDIKYLEKPTSVEEKENLHKDNRKFSFFQKKIDFFLDRYIPYVTFERSFSLNTVREALGQKYKEAPFITGDLLARLLNYAKAKNFGHERRI